MAVRLGFAVAAHLEPDILLVDEVLAVGDEGFQRKCLNKIGELRKNGAAIILVSHNMHTISTFCSKVVLLRKGRQQIYENVEEGISAYRQIFEGSNSSDMQKISSGNQHIKFEDVKVRTNQLKPGDDVVIILRYRSDKEYRNVEVDTGIFSDNQAGLYFQASNKAYEKTIDLPVGKHEFSIDFKQLQISGSRVVIALSIWTENRTELLFWWRIPIYFSRAEFSTGPNFIKLNYSVSSVFTEDYKLTR
jgi:energy-coupling factor transporter ATP-binding protein EcfA2